MLHKQIQFISITVFGVVVIMSSAAWLLNSVSPRQHIMSANKPETDEVGLVLSSDGLLAKQHIRSTNKPETEQVGLVLSSDGLLTTQHIRATKTSITRDVHRDEISIFEKQHRLTTLCAVDKVADDADSNVTSDINFIYHLDVLSQVRKIHDDNVRKQGHFERATLTKRLPKCLIIGVAKAGTEELRDFMGVHPYVVVPKKEANYFNSGYSFRKKPSHYGKGPIWYKNWMPESYASQITIEKTPKYFCTPEAPKRVHDMNKDMKLILMLREPSSRIMSHYTWRQHQPESDKKYKDFEEYIFKKGILNSQNVYFTESMYVTCMKLWLQYFDLSQFLIIESNEFRDNPLCVLQKIETLLGLEHIFNNETFVFNKEKGFYCVKDTIQTGTKYTNAYCYNQRRGRNEHSTQVNATIIRALETFFKPYNEDLFQLIGHRYDW